MSKSIVFAHGWATDHRVWAGYIESLANSGCGYGFINPDLPGHGEPGEGRWAGFDLNSAIDKYMEILEDSAVEQPLGERIGVGWSLGAQVLISIELKRPGTFKGLVLVGATPSAVSREGFPYGHQRALVKRMMIDLKREPEESLDRFYSLNFTDFELGEAPALSFLHRYNSAKKKDYDSLLNALQTHYSTDITGELGSLNLPVLVIHGTEDLVAPIAAGRFLANNIKDAKLEIFENTGHAPFLTEPDSFLRLTCDFFNEIFS